PEPIAGGETRGFRICLGPSAPSPSDGLDQFQPERRQSFQLPGTRVPPEGVHLYNGLGLLAIPGQGGVYGRFVPDLGQARPMSRFGGGHRSVLGFPDVGRNGPYPGTEADDLLEIGQSVPVIVGPGAVEGQRRSILHLRKPGLARGLARLRWGGAVGGTRPDQRALQRLLGAAWVECDKTKA